MLKSLFQDRPASFGDIVIYLFLIYLCACLYVLGHVSGHKGQKGVSEPLEMKLQGLCAT